MVSGNIFLSEPLVEIVGVWGSTKDLTLGDCNIDRIGCLQLTTTKHLLEVVISGDQLRFRVIKYASSKTPWRFFPP